MTAASVRRRRRPRILCIGLTFFPLSLPSVPPLLSRHWTENVLVCGPRKPRKRGRSPAIQRGKGRWGRREGDLERTPTRHAAAAMMRKDGEEGRGDNAKVESNCDESSLACGRQGGNVVLPGPVCRLLRPKCETEALSDILDCNCRRKEHAPLSKIRREGREKKMILFGSGFRLSAV